jgi:uncharacterized protein (DUF58 family)
VANASSNRHDFIDAKIVARLTGQGLHARMPMLGNISGRHRSPIKGASLEFAEYRKYVPGDDLRRMDWRAWGRSDRFYIREFEADTNLRLCLIVDTSGSLDFSNGGITKLRLMQSLAGTLAYVASKQGDAVGLYCAGKGFHTEIRPRRNVSHLRLVLDQLAGLRAEGETGLAEALHQAAEGIQQRALVAVFSDLFINPESLRKCFQHLKFRKHDVAMFHLLDRSEIDFDFDRPMRFLDMEGGDPIMADPSLMARQYRAAVKDYMVAVEGIMREAAVDYQRVNLDDSVAEVLARLLKGRQVKHKGGRRR